MSKLTITITITIASIGICLALGGCGNTMLPKSETNMLFWTQDQRDARFRQIEKFAPGNVVAAGGAVRELPKGTAFPETLTVGGKPLTMDAYMAAQRHAGLIILQDGKVRFERYALGFGPQERWTSFSVAKSLASTLVGAAVKDGYLKSIDDPITRYIPELGGSGYDGVTIRQVLTMTSGVKWNEDYADPKSDVALFNDVKAEPGMDVTVSYMRKLPREAAPGSKWVYKTGETNLIGVLVSKATGKTLSAYLSEKIWKPYGMAADAIWVTNASGNEISGCCISARLSDYARFGQFILEGGIAAGKPVLPANWLASATTKQADIGVPGRGYGYQWWTYDDGSVAAQGIFGQGIFIDPKRKLVIASNGDWPKATMPDSAGPQRQAFYKAVQAAVDSGATR
ncbi:beta-lactamase [Cupriavidus basilensis OR16]|uniref:Beta-lactamase n=1 Tax=Cupriavidus basilensis OR16 TaxID=1127483 RepID=H1SCW2_9BURK|nr:serine hydrolase domain-containing protein [Cupriavidus basilensis]EHP39608.1 beta-lactamase [Cupriavidus basilensis OR16]